MPPETQSPMKLKPPSKRKKIDSPIPSSSSMCSPGLPLTESRDAELNPMRKSMVCEAQNANISVRIQQARNYAVAQAQQMVALQTLECSTRHLGIILSP